MKPGNRFDRIVWVFLLCVFSATIVILWRGDRTGAQVLATIPRKGDEVSAWGRIGITFKQAMQSGTVEERFSVEGDVSGYTTWQDNTLYFIPEQPYEYNRVYRARLLPGALSVEGRRVIDEVSFEFRVRSPAVIYMKTEAEIYELWVDDLSGDPRQLTQSSGAVYDYSISRDGDTICYSRSNSQKGADIWQIARDGSDERLLLECGDDLCIQTAFSPDGAAIAYTRRQSQQAVPQIWTIDRYSGENTLIFNGSEAAWSPNGEYLAALDTDSGVINVVDLQSQQGIELKTGWDYPPVWFPDSSRLVFADIQALRALPYPLLYQLDLKTNRITGFLGDLLNDMELSMPAIAPDGEQLIISVRTVQGELTKQLWLADVDGALQQVVTNDKTFSNHGYHWDVQGERVLFQQVQLQEPEIFSRVMIWNRQNGEIQMVAQHAALPNWLP